MTRSSLCSIVHGLWRSERNWTLLWMKIESCWSQNGKDPEAYRTRDLTLLVQTRASPGIRQAILHGGTTRHDWKSGGGFLKFPRPFLKRREIYMKQTIWRWWRIDGGSGGPQFRGGPAIKSWEFSQKLFLWQVSYCRLPRSPFLLVCVHPLFSKGSCTEEECWIFNILNRV